MSRPNRARRRLLTMADVAEELGVAERTVRHYIATGKLPAIRLNARTIRIDPAAVDKLIDKASA